MRDWPVLVPETDLDAVRAERDQLKARIAELEDAEGCTVVAEELARWLTAGGWLAHRAGLVESIREHLPAVPEGYVAVDLRDIDQAYLRGQAKCSDSPGYSPDVRIVVRAARAELARRAELAATKEDN